MLIKISKILVISAIKFFLMLFTHVYIVILTCHILNVGINSDDCEKVVD